MLLVASGQNWRKVVQAAQVSHAEDHIAIATLPDNAIPWDEQSENYLIYRVAIHPRTGGGNIPKNLRANSVYFGRHEYTAGAIGGIRLYTSLANAIALTNHIPFTEANLVGVSSFTVYFIQRYYTPITIRKLGMPQVADVRCCADAMSWAIPFPAQVRIRLPQAFFLGPTPGLPLGSPDDFPLGDIDEILQWNADLGGYFSGLKNYFNIPGRLHFYPGGVAPYLFNTFLDHVWENNPNVPAEHFGGVWHQAADSTGGTRWYYGTNFGQKYISGLADGTWFFDSRFWQHPDTMAHGLTRPISGVVIYYSYRNHARFPGEDYFAIGLGGQVRSTNRYFVRSSSAQAMITTLELA